jgi:hypothetical protein
MMHICNATGASLPPLYVFEGKRRAAGLLTGGPAGAAYAMGSSGYFTEENFKHVIEFIIKHTPSTNRLFIIDGHTSHFEPSALDMCVEHNIQVLCLPSHTSHLLQVADLTIFAAFKKRLEVSCETHRLQHQHDITKYDIASITCHPWQECIKVTNVVAGFKRSGIWPLNKLAVTSDKYKLQLFEATATSTTSTSSLSSSSSSSSSSASTSAILSVPSTTVVKRAKPLKQYINHHQAAFLTEPNVLAELHDAENRKQQEQSQKQQRKRERAERKLEKEVQKRMKQHDKEAKQAAGSSKHATASNNKENIAPSEEIDPYAFNSDVHQNRDMHKNYPVKTGAVTARRIR